MQFEITYLPLAEHSLKHYKLSLNIVSGPKYDFLLNATARKPESSSALPPMTLGPASS
jgi:hypothetical protein